MKKFYVTTPLYYVNASPHIGHAYTTLAADILVRHKKARGQDAHLLTGTDEHGANIEKLAGAAGKSPQAWADEVAEQFRALWRELRIEYDDFIRTTESRHERPVQKVFTRLLDQGDIYPGSYTGWYCLPCENYYDEGELVSGNCPVHGRPVERVREETYFFRLSSYEKPLLDYYQQHPDFLSPSWRAGEIVNFVKSGLRDLSVTRTKVAWGIPAPCAPGHTIYVWFDALLNYVTAPGYDPETPAPSFEQLWPADLQLVGKEIFRFHAVTWPAMLMALGVPLPARVFAHGWWTVEGEKMSKSRGNFVDPRQPAAEFGVDALRYFLFREVPFGGDGDFSVAALRDRYNADLANSLGNLLSRVVQLVDKSLGGDIPRRPALDRPFLAGELAKAGQRIYAAMDALAFHEALSLIWEQVAELNRAVDRGKPWEKAKTDPQAFRFLMFDLVWCLRYIADWIQPFMPETAVRMRQQLGARERQLVPGAVADPDSVWGKVVKGPPLFPKKT